MTVKFARTEHQKEALPYGVADKFLLMWNTKITVTNEAAATNATRSHLAAISSIVPIDTPNLTQQTVLAKPILSKAPAELRYVRWFVFAKYVRMQNDGNFELSVENWNGVSLHVIVGFQKINWPKDQELQQVVIIWVALGIIGAEKGPETRKM